jgi:DNA repair protein RecO
MHRVFTTEGIVLGKRNAGESNTVASVLTREHGLLRAKATSARVEKSKLRFGLEPLTEGRFSFVEGRHEWKLVGVESISSEVRHVPLSHRAASARVAKLLLRLVHGEDPHPLLYEDVYAGLRALLFAQTPDDLRNIECVLVLRILSRLGYLPQSPELAPFLRSSQFSPELSHEAHRVRTYLIRTINDSLAETGL